MTATILQRAQANLPKDIVSCSDCSEEYEEWITHGASEYAISIWSSNLGTLVPIGRCDAGHSKALNPAEINASPMLLGLFEAAVYSIAQEEAGIRRILSEEYEARQMAESVA